MKKVIALLFISVVFVTSCDDNKDYIVVIRTSMGDMKVLLYDETPLHKKNFLELARAGRYDSTEWHRIIKGFMIQGGNVYEKEGTAEQAEDKIPAEIVEGFYHTKGTLAAARQPETVNPEKKSSGSQFYIVHGKVFSELELTVDQYRLNQGLSQMLAMEKYDTIRQKFVVMQQERRSAQEMNTLALQYCDLVEQELGTSLRRSVDPESLRLYTTIGGAPHLDKEYTIFGRVVEGLDVIDKIAAVETGRLDKPVQPLYMTMDIESVAKKEITEKYGYTYPETK